MRRTNTVRAARRLMAAWLLCAAPLVGCAAPGEPEEAASAPSVPAAEAVDPSLTLALVAQEVSPEGLTVALRYQRRAGAEGPRAAEIFLETSENLRLEGAEPLEAAQAAGKTLVVQAPSPGLLRVILYSTSDLREMESGALARLRFSRGGEGEARVDFAAGQVSLAPAGAARGMLLSDALVVGR